MLDEKVLREPSTRFLYAVQCPNDACRHVFHVVTVARGIRCPVCRNHYPHHKTYRALVKP